MPSISRSTLASLFLLLLTFLPLALASSGDRNPTYQHCLRGCSLTYCDPSQPPIPLYLRAFGWSCEANCRYDCAHSFTDNIRPGGRWHQFYGKWPFYRLGPLQEPFSVLMSLGNLYVNVRGIAEVRRRIRPENKLGRWLELLGWVQVNTWVWSAVFHSRDTPSTERLDYFSATLTISLTLLYTLLRTLSLQTPLNTSRFTPLLTASLALLVLSHFTYVLSFPRDAFPYGYHTFFNLALGLSHHVLWILFSLSFFIRIPIPYPYPPNDPLIAIRPADALTPIMLVGLTTLAMSFELLDFAPVFRTIDAHAIWHASTIPLAISWWGFLIKDAIELEGTLLATRGGAGVSASAEQKMPLSGGGSTERQSFTQIASSPGLGRSPILGMSARSPIVGGAGFSPAKSSALPSSMRSPMLGEKGDRVD